MNRIARQYDAFLLSRSDQARAVLALENIAARNKWRFVLFGGSARDIYLHGENAQPRDLDIVVDGVTIEALQAELGFKDKTAFDGLKGELGGIPVDIWPLDKTWAFTRINLRGKKPTFDDLVLTTPFNLEAIAIEPAVTTILYDGGAVKCLAEKCLELSYESNANAFVALTIVRAAWFAKRYGLTFGRHLSAFIAKNFKKVEKRLAITQKGYYGHEKLTTDEIREILKPVFAA